MSSPQTILYPKPNDTLDPVPVGSPGRSANTHVDLHVLPWPWLPTRNGQEVDICVGVTLIVKHIPRDPVAFWEWFHGTQWLKPDAFCGHWLALCLQSSLPHRLGKAKSGDQSLLLKQKAVHAWASTMHTLHAFGRGGIVQFLLPSIHWQPSHCWK